MQYGVKGTSRQSRRQGAQGKEMKGQGALNTQKNIHAIECTLKCMF